MQGGLEKFAPKPTLITPDGFENVKIDAVLLWQNFADVAWVHQRNQFAANSSADLNTPAWLSSAEIVCRIKSILVFAGFINKIFLVVPHESQVASAVPPELQALIASKAVTVIYYRQIVPQEVLPTFSSNFIAANLYKIPEIAEFFVTVGFGDLFGRPVSKCDLLARADDGSVVSKIRLSRAHGDMLAQFKATSKSLYRKTVAANTKLIESFYKDKTVKHPRRMPSNGPLIHSRSIAADVAADFKNQIDVMKAQRFRSEGDLLVGLVEYHRAIATGSKWTKDSRAESAVAIFAKWNESVGNDTEAILADPPMLIRIGYQLEHVEVFKDDISEFYSQFLQ